MTYQKGWMHAVGLAALACAGAAGSAQTDGRLNGRAEFATRDQSAGTSAAASALKPEDEGDLQMARGSYAAALASYQRVQPQNAVMMNKIGVAYHHLFAFDQAQKYYEKAVAMNTKYAEAYNNLGAVYYGKIEYAAAVKAYKKAIKYNSRLSVAYRNLGAAYFAEYKYGKGTSAFRKAFDIDPEIFDGDSARTVEEFGTLTQKMETAFYLAKILASLKRNDEALASLRKAMNYGFKDRKRLMQDEDLRRLRDTPEFYELLREEHLSAEHT